MSCLAVHPKKVLSIHKKLYLLLSQIHSIPVNSVSSFWYLHGYHGIVEKRFYTFLKDEIDKTLRVLSKVSLASSVRYNLYEHTARLLQYVLHMPFPVPIHGDVSPENIIITHINSSCNIARLLDFERAQIGDRVWDFVYYYGYIERINQNVATSWRKIIVKRLSKREKQAFLWYRTLFHAWSVRDGIEYSDNTRRKELARYSLKILETIH